MQTRYVDVNLFIDELLKIDDFNMISTQTISDALDRTPTADVVKVVHGIWKRKVDEIYCSECNFRFYPVMFRYCPGCGAKMEVYK